LDSPTSTTRKKTSKKSGAINIRTKEVSGLYVSNTNWKTTKSIVCSGEENDAIGFL